MIEQEVENFLQNFEKPVFIGMPGYFAKKSCFLSNLLYFCFAVLKHSSDIVSEGFQEGIGFVKSLLSETSNLQNISKIDICQIFHQQGCLDLKHVERTLKYIQCSGGFFKMRTKKLPSDFAFCMLFVGQLSRQKGVDETVTNCLQNFGVFLTYKKASKYFRDRRNRSEKRAEKSFLSISTLFPQVCLLKTPVYDC